ncbi:hypothetical protein [Streptomyces sp. MBT55]|uniref:hypothetical protein n=1 Tax=Streptomyces sp. MBT55 TaxID=1488386 RepID=UPI001913C989|nr:hypothetical protein [Streptomyces sp. MBT55]MBK6040830.1 hypothetical protein [Streptomyces sp. MBT55]
MTDFIEFHPAPRPLWVLFSDADAGGVTFALMPGWATVEGQSGIRWAALTWQNLHNFEAEVLDTESHIMLRMWDSATRPAPALDEVLAVLRARKSGATAEELADVQNDYQQHFPSPAP